MLLLALISNCSSPAHLHFSSALELRWFSSRASAGFVKSALPATPALTARRQLALVRQGALRSAGGCSCANPYTGWANPHN